MSGTCYEHDPRTRCKECYNLIDDCEYDFDGLCEDCWLEMADENDEDETEEKS